MDPIFQHIQKVFLFLIYKIRQKRKKKKTLVNYSVNIK